MLLHDIAHIQHPGLESLTLLSTSDFEEKQQRVPLDGADVIALINNTPALTTLEINEAMIDNTETKAAVMEACSERFKAGLRVCTYYDRDHRKDWQHEAAPPRPPSPPWDCPWCPTLEQEDANDSD